MTFSQYATELYRETVAAQQYRLDAYANGYATEERTFYAEIEPRITFKDILIQLRGSWRASCE